VLTININGGDHKIDAPDDMPLLWALRDLLGLTGTKFGCGIAQCGACTVHIDRRPVRSCVLPVGAIPGRKITTIEAIGATSAGKMFKRHGLATRWSNAITVNQVRSWRPLRCMRAIPHPAMPRSMRPWRGIFAVAANKVAYFDRVQLAHQRMGGISFAVLIEKILRIGDLVGRYKEWTERQKAIDGSPEYGQPQQLAFSRVPGISVCPAVVGRAQPFEDVQDGRLHKCHP
jgi:hypothetical protein